jgi:hypothetical protein
MIRFSFGKFETKKQAYHPFLIGILFLSNELRFNFNYYSFWECFLLIAIILAFCTFTFLIIKQILKNELKAGLISTSFIIINIFFHDIVNKLQEIQFFTASLSDSVIPADILYIPFLGLVWVVFCIYILKSKKGFQLINSYLNLVITIFILIEISKWIYGPNVEIKISDHTNFKSEHVQNKSGKPDIYYIILDSYTSSESLNEFWNYDNSGFQDSLKKEGFYIANKSKSDYASTYFCMASYLNSSLLNSDSVTISSNQILIGLIRNNKIIDFFNRQGYSIYNYSIFDLTGLEKVL